MVPEVISALRRIGTAAALCAVLPSLAAAQNTGTIRGQVSGSAREPIADVQVSVVGTTLGALSGTNGSFVIANVPEGTVQIRTRRLGYGQRTQSVTITAGQDTRVELVLTPTASQLEQIVVTGTAGAAEKRTVGNAITQVDVSDVTRKTNVSNMLEVLQARSPGVQIVAENGTPGTAPDIRIRGASSLSVTPPVVYIDGVRMSTEGRQNFNPSGQGLSANSGGSGANLWNLVSPDQVESVEIIKGPAASTLYGADAAGGVIQIITKKGARGQQRAQWGARLDMGQSDLGSVTLPLNYTTCTQANIDARITVSGVAQPLFPGCQGLTAGTVITQSPLRDMGGLRTGGLQKFSAHVRGGSDRTSYYVSGDHAYDEGVLGNSFERRRGVRSNFSFSPGAKADVSVNAAIADDHLRLPLEGESAQGLLFSALRGTPGRISFLPGQPQQGFLTVTPQQSNQYDNESRNQRVILGTTLNYQPFSWFRNRFTAGLDWTFGLATLFAPPNAPWLTGDTLGLTAQRIPRSTLYTLDYAGSVEHSFTADLLSTTSVGSQVIARRTEALFSSGRGLGTPDVTLIGSTTTISSSNSFVENNSVGYYVQQQLGWKNRIFGTVALRADDNSSFGTKFNAAYYPKASLSWILSEEPRLASLFSTLHADNFKFRTAWGEAGRAPSPYSASRTYTISVVTLGTGTASALRTNAFGNPGLKPERGQELELGFESDFFSGRGGVDFTYYNKRMNDVLVSTSVAPSTGFRSSQLANIGSTSNTGIELSLLVSPVVRQNFGWDSRISLSTNHNKLLSFGDTSIKFLTIYGSYGTVQQHRVGYPLGGYWAPYPKRNPDGTLLLVSGAVVPDTASYIGPSMPTRDVALSNTFTIFRDFSLYSLFSYQGGFFNYRGVDIYRCAFSRNCRELNDPNFPADQLPLYQAGVSNVPRAIHIHKADFWKLRDLSLTYRIPARYASVASASAASVTLAGHNLALWSSYPGPDPEVNSYGYWNSVLGLFVRGDIYSMPMTRRLSASLDLTF